MARKEGSLTAIRISIVIVVYTPGAIVKLAFRWNIRDAALNPRPHGLAFGVTIEQLGRRPYCWELVNVLVRGRIVIWGAFDGGICHNIGVCG